jgi:hypothetical protein
MTVFGVTYALLLGLVALWGRVLHYLIGETIWLRRLYGPQDEGLLVLGSRVPEIGAVRELLTGRSITLADMKGHMVMFVSARNNTPRQYRSLAISVHALRLRAEGKLFLVCDGSPDECWGLLGKMASGSPTRKGLPVLVDPAGAVARAFRVSRRSMAIGLDDQARIQYYGFQRS